MKKMDARYVEIKKRARQRGEHDQGLILSFGKSVKHGKCHIVDA